jgi:hypothetical protein
MLADTNWYKAIPPSAVGVALQWALGTMPQRAETNNNRQGKEWTQAN